MTPVSSRWTLLGADMCASVCLGGGPERSASGSSFRLVGVHRMMPTGPATQPFCVLLSCRVSERVLCRDRLCQGPYVIQVAAALLYAGVCSHGIIMEHRGHVIR